MRIKRLKKDTFRYCMFAFSFLTMLILTIGFIMFLDTCNAKSTNDAAADTYGNSSYIQQDNYLDMNADAYETSDETAKIIDAE